MTDRTSAITPPARSVPREDAARHGRRSALQVGLGLFVLGTPMLLVSRSAEPAVIALLAPLLEEFLKGGLALLLIGALGLRRGPYRFALGLLPGAGFAWMEHAGTYPGEPLEAFTIRIAFHAATSALTAVAFHVVEPVGEPRLLAVVTLPSTMFHYANNVVVLALLLGLLPVEDPLRTSDYVSLATTVALWTLTVALTLGRREARRVLHARFGRR